MLGYSQHKNLAFIQIADFASVYGVSFMVMMVNVAIFKLFKKALREWIIASLIILMVVGYGTMKLNEKIEGDTIKVSVIQGNIPQDMKWDPLASDDILDRYINLTRIAAFDRPDLIIWPETSFPGFFVSDKVFTKEVFDLAKGISTPLLLGANTEKGLKNFNSAVLVSRQGNIIGKYDKMHLVPFGEYVPFSDSLSILHNLVLGELGEFTQGKEYKIFRAGKYSFAAMICFEDIFPEISSRFVKDGAEFLVVLTNDAWYGMSSAAYQHAACSVFRAIENRVPLVRCANTGYSCFIDRRGRIYDAVEKEGIHLFVIGHKTSKITLP